MPNCQHWFGNISGDALQTTAKNFKMTQRVHATISVLK